MTILFATRLDDHPRCSFRSGIHEVGFPRRMALVPCRVGISVLAPRRIRGVACSNSRAIASSQGSRACEGRAEALDDVARRRLTGSAAAVQGGAGVSEPEVQE